MSSDSRETILLVDDDAAFRTMLCEALTEKGYAVEEAGSAEEGLKAVAGKSFDLVLMDVMLPGMTGIEAIPKVLEADPLADIIVMTAHASKQAALEAIRLGAYDFFTKPFSLGEMEVVIKRALEKRRLQDRVRHLRQALEGMGAEDRIIGGGPAMARVRALVERVAALNATVLVTGASGTGKEVVSDAIHALSPRADGPYVKINCAAIPENLLESELFGHEKGAFTGAGQAKKGKFELAEGGTILLDEIGDMPLHLQPKLLRAVEQKQAERLGGHKPVSFDVRIIAATNQDLEDLIREKKFRDDLFYRLNVAAIHLPPLAERREDIPALAEHFLKAINVRNGTGVDRISPGAMERLYAAPWPGNVRQLANVLERAVIFCRDRQLSAEDVDLALGQGPGPEAPPALELTGNLRDTLNRMEKELILQALDRAGGVQAKAARTLGITPKNLWNKLQKHGIGA